MSTKILLLLAIIGGFFLVLGINAITTTLPISTLEVVPPDLTDEPDPQTLAKAIAIPTVSYDHEGQIGQRSFEYFIRFLQQQFPLVHARLDVERVNDFSLLYVWHGAQPLEPVLLTAHYDVVPAELTEDGGQWEVAPFAGEIRDGYIWGRGAMDDKAAVVAILTASERLLKNGHVPRRTLIFAFGHDEEIGGEQGAARLAQRLRERDLSPAWMLDEGMPITDGIISAVPTPVAMVGIAEKGYLTVEMSVTTESGHSSSPPKETAIGILARAIARLEDSPLPARIDGASEAMFERLSPAMSWVPRVLFSNRWLFDSVIKSQLEGKPATNAIIRTTAAVTVFKGGEKENVLPASASATVNFRLLPGDNAEYVLAHLTRVVDDSRVQIVTRGKPSEASQVSDYDNEAFLTIEQTIRQVFPNVNVAPALLIATTDTRHYAPLTANIYRFRPVWVKPDDVQRFHGINERIAIDNYQKMVAFFHQLMKNIDATSKMPF